LSLKKCKGGEKMKKKILCLIFSLIFVAVSITPVIAESKSSVPIKIYSLSQTPSPLTRFWQTETSAHGRNGTLVYSGTVIKNATERPYTQTVADLYGGTFVWTIDYNVDTVMTTQQFIIGVGTTHISLVMTFEHGTFEGNLILEGKFKVSLINGGIQQISGTRHGLLHGTGNYRGWKILISGAQSLGEDPVIEIILTMNL
jgi:hypothetical protein